jgi:hypothetical protein
LAVAGIFATLVPTAVLGHDLATVAASGIQPREFASIEVLANEPGRAGPDNVVVGVHQFNADLAGLVKSLSDRLAAVRDRGGWISVDVRGKPVELLVAPGGQITMTRSAGLEIRPILGEEPLAAGQSMAQIDSKLLKSVSTAGSLTSNGGWDPAGRFAVRHSPLVPPSVPAAGIGVPSAEPSSMKNQRRTVDECQADCEYERDVNAAYCDFSYDADVVWADAILIGGPSVCVTVAGAVLEAGSVVSLTPQVRATVIAMGGTCSVGAAAVGLTMRLVAAHERFVCKANALAKHAACLARCQ